MYKKALTEKVKVVEQIRVNISKRNNEFYFTFPNDLSPEAAQTENRSSQPISAKCWHFLSSSWKIKPSSLRMEIRFIISLLKLR